MWAAFIWSRNAMGPWHASYSTGPLSAFYRCPAWRDTVGTNRSIEPRRVMKALCQYRDRQKTLVVSVTPPCRGVNEKTVASGSAPIALNMRSPNTVSLFNRAQQESCCLSPALTMTKINIKFFSALSCIKKTQKSHTRLLNNIYFYPHVQLSPSCPHHSKMPPCSAAAFRKRRLFGKNNGIYFANCLHNERWFQHRTFATVEWQPWSTNNSKTRHSNEDPLPYEQHPKKRNLYLRGASQRKFPKLLFFNPAKDPSSFVIHWTMVFITVYYIFNLTPGETLPQRRRRMLREKLLDEVGLTEADVDEIEGMDEAPLSEEGAQSYGEVMDPIFEPKEGRFTAAALRCFLESASEDREAEKAQPTLKYTSHGDTKVNSKPERFSADRVTQATTNPMEHRAVKFHPALMAVHALKQAEEPLPAHVRQASQDEQFIKELFSHTAKEQGDEAASHDRTLAHALFPDESTEDLRLPRRYHTASKANNA